MSDESRESTSGFLRRHPTGHTEFLLERACAGSDRAWGEIFRRSLPRLRLDYRIRIPHHLERGFHQEDVLQETFLKAWKQRGRFVYETEEKFRRWLMAIAASQYRMLLRSHGRRLRGHFSESQVNLAEIAHTDEEPSPQEEEEFQLEVLRRLATKDVDALYMRETEGLDFESMGRAMGLSIRQAQTRYRHAVERREYWSRRLRDGDGDGAGR